jgi:hypothetical protein
LVIIREIVRPGCDLVHTAHLFPKHEPEPRIIGQVIAVTGWVSELRDPPSLQQATTTAVTSIAADRTNLFDRIREYSPIANNVGQQCNSIIGSGATTP